MRLIRLSVQRVPGIDEKFSIGPLESDPVLILGPNGSGKSTTRRALRALLFGEKEYTNGVELDAVFEDSKGELHASLSSGKVAWKRAGKPCEAPDLPIATRASCFAVGVRDLLDDSGQSEEDLARAVRRQLTGGYDMEALLKGPYAVGQFEAKRHGDALVGARDKVNQLEIEQQQLTEKEDRLSDLRARRDAAVAAGREVSRLELALKLVGSRNAENSSRSGLEAFEAGLEATAERDLEQSDEFSRELAESSELLERCTAKLAQAEQREARALGAGVELDPGELERREAELAGLRDLERDLEQALAAEGQMAAREGAAREELRGEREAEAEPEAGPEFERLAPLEPNELRELDAYFDEAEELEGRRSMLSQQREHLRSRVIPAMRGNPAEGTEVLREWLRAPVPDDLEFPQWVPILGVLVVLVGAALATVVHPLFAIVAGIGATAALLQPIVSRTRHRFMSERVKIANKFRHSDQDQPTKWQEPAVIKRLKELEELVHASEVSDEYALEADVVDRELRRTEQRLTEHAEFAEELRDRLGVNLEGGRITRRELVHRISEMRAARADLERTRAERQRLENRTNSVAGGLASFLEGAGCVIDRHPGDPESTPLRTAWKQLAEAEGARREARRLREEAETEQPGLSARVERIEQRRREFFAARHLELGDQAGLERLSLQRTSYLGQREQLAESERERRRLETELGEDAVLAELERVELEERLERARARAGSAGELEQEIGRISNALETEMESDRLGAAAATLLESEEKLATKRRSLMTRAAGQYLLEDVALEYESQSRPDVLKRAADLFADFTSDRYHLEVQGESDNLRVEFKAKETDSGRRLGLRELSDGTRMQLLLAVRIAFAEEAERGEKIPLVLDEAFSLSDSHRFRAMVGAVYDLVSRGRQVLYMSANLHEDQIWQQLAEEQGDQPPNLIDMAVVRKLANAARTPKGLIVPKAPRIPTSKDKSPEDYAHELGVALPRPHLPAESLHLYHLLHDNLPLLEKLLRSRIETLGQWRASSDRGNGPSLCGDAERSRLLDARCGVAKQAVDAWHVGRGKPIGRPELDRADGVTEARIDEVEELALREGGDPERLVAALRNKQIKGYRVASIDKLEAWLEAQGLLDTRPTMDLESLHRETLGGAKRYLSNGAIEAQEVHDLADRLFQQLENASSPSVEPATEPVSGHGPNQAAPPAKPAPDGNSEPVAKKPSGKPAKA